MWVMLPGKKRVIDLMTKFPAINQSIKAFEYRTPCKQKQKGLSTSQHKGLKFSQQCTIIFVATGLH